MKRTIHQITIFVITVIMVLNFSSCNLSDLQDKTGIVGESLAFYTEDDTKDDSVTETDNDSSIMVTGTETEVEAASSETEGISETETNGTEGSVGSDSSEQSSDTGKETADSSGIVDTTQTTPPDTSPVDTAHTHKYIVSSTKAPTCTEEGYTVYKCSCGDSYRGDTKAALGHAYKVTKTVSATCTEGGYKTYTCSRCGSSYNGDKTSALGHSFGSWVVTKAATESADGSEKRTCSRCSYAETRAIPKLAGKYDVPPTEDNWRLIAERVVYYINQYRVAEGVPAATYVTGGKGEQFCKIRSQQLVTNFAHDTKDIREVTGKLKFGVYSDFGDGTGYWQEPLGEAIGTHSGGYTTVDALAKEIATGVYNSKGHWAYIGAASSCYLVCGVTTINNWSYYICLGSSAEGYLQYD